jgi:hypothetical protein
MCWCRTSKCARCGPAKIERYKRAIAAAPAPLRLITLTRTPEAAEPTYRALQGIQWRLRRRAIQMRWVWTREENPGGTGFHIHAVATGDFVPAQVLFTCAARAGLGRPRVEAVRDPVAMASYLWRGFDKNPDDFLTLNFGRIAHASHGFLDPTAALVAP